MKWAQWSKFAKK